VSEAGVSEMLSGIWGFQRASAFGLKIRHHEPRLTQNIKTTKWHLTTIPQYKASCDALELQGMPGWSGLLADIGDDHSPTKLRDLPSEGR